MICIYCIRADLMKSECQYLNWQLRIQQESVALEDMAEWMEICEDIKEQL